MCRRGSEILLSARRPFKKEHFESVSDKKFHALDASLANRFVGITVNISQVELSHHRSELM